MSIKIQIDGNSHEISGGLVEANAIYELAGCGDKQLFLNQSDEIDIPLDRNIYLIIQNNMSFVSGKSKIEDNPPLRNHIRLTFNGEPSPEISKAKLTGGEIKKFESELSDGRLFADISIGPDVEISDDMRLLVQPNDSFFIIPASEGSKFGEPIDIEECSRHDRRPPKGKNYLIRVDKNKYFVEERISGKEILALANKETTEWALNQKFKGGRRERIKSDDIVNVSKRGVERFETVRLQAQQGHE